MPPSQYSGMGPAAMPSPCSSRAPYFSGAVKDPIEDFLQDYELQADSCDLTDRQKAENVIRYIPLTLRSFWKAQDGYSTGDWRTMKLALLDEYGDAAGVDESTKQQLVNLVNRSARFRMKSGADVVEYYRQFSLLSRPLIDSESRRLATGDRDELFWAGFHPRDQDSLFLRLIALHPMTPPHEAFYYKDVYKMARAVFSAHNLRTREDKDAWEKSRRYRRSGRTRERRHNRGEDDLQDEGSESRSYFPPRIETKQVRFKDMSREEENRELEDLVLRMRKLQTHEDAYAVLHARCTVRFPTVAQTLDNPIRTQHTSTPSSTTTFSVHMTSTVSPHVTQPLWTAPNPPPAQQHIANTTTTFFRARPRSEGCAFCLHPSHRIRACPTAQEYVRLGHVLVLDDRLSLPSRQSIPNDGTGRGLKHGVDTWLAAQAQTAPAATQSFSFMRDAPPRSSSKHDNRPSSAHIEEVTEAHIVQVVSSDSDSEEEEDGPLDFFQVFAAEKKKRENRRVKLPELQATSPPANAATSSRIPVALTGPGITPPTDSPADPPVLTTAAPPVATNTPPPTWATPQYWYQSTAEDQQLVSELESWLLDGKLAQITPAHVLAASPSIRKDLVEKLRVRRVDETSSYEEAADTFITHTPPGRTPRACIRACAA